MKRQAFSTMPVFSKDTYGRKKEMDKRAIKNFAVSARRKLIDEVTIKAKRLGINESGIEKAKQIDSKLQEIESSGLRIHGKEVAQRNQLITELNRRATVSSHPEAFQELIEEVAYTWFNRLIAIRFMEVNDYLPDTYRVLSSETSGKIEPDLITDIYDSDIYEELSSNEQQLVQAWKSDNSAEAMDKLYQLIFIKICNQLNDYLPELFEKVEDYTELLFTASYIKKDGVIAKLLNIPEENFNVQDGGQVEIIGWLYQYYNSEPKDKIINARRAANKGEIPFVTQLFTTDWVVKYMVENSLGRYWIERNPDSELAKEFDYFMPGGIEHLYETIDPKTIKVMDNAMGSGHILVYVFDVLMKIYESVGYAQKDAAKSIVENNLFGLDIDKRAFQLAYFSIMMKGRQYDRLFLKREIKSNIKVFIDFTGFTEDYIKKITEKNNDNGELIERFKVNIFDKFTNAKELGSIIKLVDGKGVTLTKEELVSAKKYFSKIDSFDNLDILYGLDEKHEQIKTILSIAGLMLNQYDIVITNPPYLNKMQGTLKKYINSEYKDFNPDLYAVFVANNIKITKEQGYLSFMSPLVWMFIKSFEKLRIKILEETTISSLIQMEYNAYDEAMVPICTYTLKKDSYHQNNIGTYIRLSDFKGNMKVQEKKVIDAINNNDVKYIYFSDQEDFRKIHGVPIAYWINNNLLNKFTLPKVGDYLITREGMATANNELYVREWYEVSYEKIGFGVSDYINHKKWYPYNKGGKFKKWYGNNQLVVDWEEDGKGIKNNRDKKTGRLRSHNYNGAYSFKEGITWSALSSGAISFRFSPKGALFDSKGAMGFSNGEDIRVLLAFLNSTIAQKYLEVFSPTLDYKVGDVIQIPYLLKNMHVEERTQLTDLTEELIEISKNYYKLMENSYDFDNLLLHSTNSVRELDCYLKKYISILNKNNKCYQFFIEEIIAQYYDYELKKQEVIFDKDFPDLNIAKCLVSFSVGVILGRYSLDKKGLIYAGGDWNSSCYQKFKPDVDNVLLITDDEYFKDSQIDIVNRFIDFVEVTFGIDTLEENLQFIADTLGGKGTSREVIRRYFVKDFYKDHLKTYSNRPIYWQLDSGKQNGFKALMYLHRYTPDQLGKVRTEYLHELQKAYDNRIELRQQQISTSDNQKEINTMTKEIEKIQKQLKEVREYDEKLGHLALKRIELDLDDGVIVNYDKLQRDPDTGEKYQILAKGVKTPKK